MSAVRRPCALKTATFSNKDYAKTLSYMCADYPAGTNIRIYFNKRTGTQRILIGKVRNNSAANESIGIIDYILPVKRLSNRSAPIGDRVGSFAKGHTDSGRLPVFVFFLWHDSFAAATSVLPDRVERHE